LLIKYANIDARNVVDTCLEDWEGDCVKHIAMEGSQLSIAFWRFTKHDRLMERWKPPA
jgi:hypothetical protein